VPNVFELILELADCSDSGLVASLAGPACLLPPRIDLKAALPKPHRADTFKLSTDSLFIDKVRDVVGLYLDPPDTALVLCVDEKSQVQALDRSAPVLPMMPGMPERRPHDYVRNGVSSLFAALDVASGQVISSLHRRHRSTEFRTFLNTIDKQVPADPEVHLIADNYAIHKTDIIQN